MPRVYIKFADDASRRKFYDEVERIYKTRCYDIDDPSNYVGLSDKEKARKKLYMERTNELLWDTIEEMVFNMQNKSL